MTSSDIQYRPIQSSDYPALEDIIRKTWKYDRLGSPKLAKQLAEVDLAGRLANQTFTSVALSKGEPVGVIMGTNRATHRKPLKYLVRQWLTTARIALSKEGRKIGNIFGEIDRVDERLLKDARTDFEAELSFFVVDGNERGSGVGKQLYQQFLDYMETENLKTFFLFTDTTCTYGFYEHQGLKRLAEEPMDIPQLQEHMRFFLYGNV